MKSKTDFSAREKGDIARAQDLTMAVVNMISLEEHLAFTAMKTKKYEYYEISRNVREIRVSLMKELLEKPEGELWCSSKHTLSAMMRLIEVASKSDEDKCKHYLEAAFTLYRIFWFMMEVSKNEGHKSKAPRNERKNGKSDKKSA
ncbi:hypothetical protein HYZ41_00475 [archaeon]|nr:hypothetical protein [archaeon]